MRGDGSPGPKTLRQLAFDWATPASSSSAPPRQVAQQDGRSYGGDRRRRLPDHEAGLGSHRQYISTICDGLVPALQRLGLTRTEYTESTLRETLREF